MDTLQLKSYTLGPLENNAYLLHSGKHALLIDAPYCAAQIAADLQTANLTLDFIILTHAHFDHFAGLDPLLAMLPNTPAVLLHQWDEPLWRQGGFAGSFDVDLEVKADVQMTLAQGQRLMLDEHAIEVLHTPGHAQGHVCLYAPELTAVFCGDVLFRSAIGRTDLPFGDQDQLLATIREKLFTLPDETIAYPGHGPATTIGMEKRFNPFL